MKRAFVPVAVATTAAMMSLGLTGTAVAAANPSGTGQPNASCETSTSRPAGFSSPGFAHAETVYAGSEGSSSAQHAASTQAVSQYDVACFQVSQH
jgi:hypothetical protein